MIMIYLTLAIASSTVALVARNHPHNQSDRSNRDCNDGADCNDMDIEVAHDITETISDCFGQ